MKMERNTRASSASYRSISRQSISLREAPRSRSVLRKREFPKLKLTVIGPDVEDVYATDILGEEFGRPETRTYTDYLLAFYKLFHSPS
jgi:hypothetical protein